jgi:hypothetical protein
VSHATTGQLATWLDDDAPDGAEHLLDRATELIDEHIVSTYDIDDDDVKAALADATCAQVEFWLEVGEEHDVSGQRGQISVAGLQISKLPPTLALRARRALTRENLLSRSVQAV